MAEDQAAAAQPGAVQHEGGQYPAEPTTGPLSAAPMGMQWRARPSGALSDNPANAATSVWAPNSAAQFGTAPNPAAYGTGAYGVYRQPVPYPTGGAGFGAPPRITVPGSAGPLPGGPGTKAPRKGGRTAAIVAATVVLALGAGFGGGVLGSRVGSSNSAASDTSLSLATTANPAAATSAPSGSVQSVAQKLLPSVVSILSTSAQQEGEGSGIILTANGLILTNNHVVAGATNLTVQFNDGSTAPATVVGTDSTDDLAVIRVSGVSNLTPATLGSSADLQVGQQVVAVGSPLGLSATVTSGIVSALNRPVRTASESQGQGGSPYGQQQQTTDSTVLNAIQTDAAINPGNSGGPLVDMQGRVIGINSAIATVPNSSQSGQSGNIGVGFAIPIDQAHRIAQEIIDTGKATHAVFGASVSDATTSSSSVLTVGAQIQSVTAGGAAEKAGLRNGDVVTKVGSAPVESADALIATIRSQTPGSTVEITYQRGSQTESAKVTLGSAAAN